MVSGEGEIFDVDILLGVAKNKSHFFFPVDDVRYRVTQRRGADTTTLNE